MIEFISQKKETNAQNLSSEVLYREENVDFFFMSPCKEKWGMTTHYTRSSAPQTICNDYFSFWGYMILIKNMATASSCRTVFLGDHLVSSFAVSLHHCSTGKCYICKTLPMDWLCSVSSSMVLPFGSFFPVIVLTKRLWQTIDNIYVVSMDRPRMNVKL